MRLWSIHPRYLDAKGLVALWREGLLAQKVLRGKTKGYKNHPQLLRFKQTRHPLGAIASYLRHVCDEAEQRGYTFDRKKINAAKYKTKIVVTSGQAAYEFAHLLGKLKQRDPLIYQKYQSTTRIQLHPLFNKIRGKVADWEIR